MLRETDRSGVAVMAGAPRPAVPCSGGARCLQGRLWALTKLHTFSAPLNECMGVFSAR